MSVATSVLIQFNGSCDELNKLLHLDSSCYEQCRNTNVPNLFYYGNAECWFGDTIGYRHKPLANDIRFVGISTLLDMYTEGDIEGCKIYNRLPRVNVKQLLDENPDLHFNGTLRDLLLKGFTESKSLTPYAMVGLFNIHDINLPKKVMYNDSLDSRYYMCSHLTPRYIGDTCEEEHDWDISVVGYSRNLYCFEHNALIKRAINSDVGKTRNALPSLSMLITEAILVNIQH